MIELLFLMTGFELLLDWQDTLLEFELALLFEESLPSLMIEVLTTSWLLLLLLRLLMLELFRSLHSSDELPLF